MSNWKSYSSCRGLDPNTFYPMSVGGRPPKAGRPDIWNKPRLICKQCPVQAQCLNYALDNNYNDGMWGGKTPEERKVMTRLKLRSHNWAMSN